MGPYAKGTQSKESDIDVAVVVDEVDGDWLIEEAKLYKLRRKVDLRIELVLFEKGHDRSGFLESILSTGEIVYQKT
jgi:predicted nucleotidyltransferase